MNKKSAGRLLDATSRKDEVQSFPAGRLADKGVLCLYQQGGGMYFNPSLLKRLERLAPGVWTIKNPLTLQMQIASDG
ncbi:hypothetical protein [Sporosarcina sp. NPDC096371]|uniref:hypothetical protein n=1 Tax=Sporosarcina sp. NPDC096371 TaxID=3364530 RepID=UPI003817E5CF